MLYDSVAWLGVLVVTGCVTFVIVVGIVLLVAGWDALGVCLLLRFRCGI